MKQLVGLVALASMLAATVAPAAAASGIAYDSVTKFAIGGDAASAQPGTFDGDFQTASQPAPAAAPARGGLFGGLNAALAQATSVSGMLKNGLAERHFIAGERERTDNVAAQSATILDCQARTLTTLDLKAKTYKVVSLDQPQPQAPAARGGPPAPQAVATDDGSRISMNLTNQALGPKQIGSDLATGFRSNVTMTITRPNSQPFTSQMMTTEYVINFPDTKLTCGSVSPGAPGPGAAALQQYAVMQRAMAQNNSRFTVTTSGPTPPHGQFSLFTVVTMGGAGASGGPPSAGGGAPGGFASIIERGHERTIQSDDPIFSVPPDFTKTN